MAKPKIIAAAAARNEDRISITESDEAERQPNKTAER
jgi:hypothetical protein